MKKHLLPVISLLFSISFSSYALSNYSEFPQTIIYSSEDQLTLSDQNSSWSKVLPGKVLYPPQETSYGFIAVTDARNIMAFSSEGQTLFTKTIPRTPKPVLTVLPYDFIILITENGHELQLLNPSGVLLWKKTLDSEVVTQPLAGKDGRFFVATQKKIYCFGINGICKWEQPIDCNKEDCKNLNLAALPDGTIAVNINKQLIRFSPFGETLPSFSMDNRIISTETCAAGLLLFLSNNMLCLYNDNSILWTLKEICRFSITKDESTIIAVSDIKSKPLSLSFVNISNGEILNKTEYDNLQKTEDIEINTTEQGFLIRDKNKCVYYKNDGNCLWNAKFPAQNNKNRWNYLFITSTNYLIFCHNNWNLDAYRFDQSAGIRKKSDENNYENFYSTMEINQFFNIYTNKLDETLTAAETYDLLSEGHYGIKEQKIISGLYSATKAYYTLLNTSNYGTRPESSIFKKDSTGISKMLKLTSLFGTDTFNDHTSLFLRNDKNISNQIILLQGIAANGYDPELKLLDAISQFSHKVSPKEKKLLTCICDAVYSICTYMGTQAFSAKGKAILSGFLYPSYSAETRAYARKTLTNLADFNQ